MSRWLAVFIVVLLVSAGCGGEEPTAPAPGSAPDASASASASASDAPDFAGSRSCRVCHERFYQLWAPSHHGTAMQPFTTELAETALKPQDDWIEALGGSFRYDADRGAVLERGENGEHVWKIEHVMGGKNVYFLLTALDRGRLQVLPVAYDVDDETWYDTTASMVRHAVGHTDEAVDWKDPLLTFNTSCWNCHVSQLTVNYDPDTDTYESRWAEAGINCETCHDSALEHIRVCEEAAEGTVPDDLKIILVSAFDETQTNDTCAPCHAKVIQLTADFTPGDAYFDHFDLTCLEDLDFYPDGRDLGENYTFTLWRMSPCAKSGQLDCVHCHTSSGRTRFTGEQSNSLCLPCHEDHVADAAAHSHHPADSEGSRCVSCHMPMTEFARMRRSDHSLRPPAPSLTLAFDSPNACNLCHADETPEWADEHVRQWRERDYQAPILRAARLVADAREADWKRLDDVLAYVQDGENDEVVRTTLIRLLAQTGDPRKVPVFLAVLGDPSPLVRSAAASGLQGGMTPEVIAALLEATADPVRLVRVRAAGALSGLPPGDLPAQVRTHLEQATAEMEAALTVRPDAWTTYYNLGNLHAQRGEHEQAFAAFARASRLRPDVEAPWVNAAMLHARLGQLGLAENALRAALEAEPESAAANFNLGLLLAEKERPREARERLRAALEADPELAPAAYNLAGLLGDDGAEEALDLYRRAWEAMPEQARYAFAYGWALHRAEADDEALRVLGDALGRGVVSADVYGLLVAVYEAKQDAGAVQAVLKRAASDPRLSPRERAAFAARLRGAR